MPLIKLVEYFLVGDKEKHSRGASTEVSPGGHCGPQIAGGFSAHCKSKKFHRSLFPSSGISTKDTSEAKPLLPWGSDHFSCVGKAPALLLQALSSALEVTSPHTAQAVGGISSCQISQDEPGHHHMLSWMRFACHSL